MNENAVIHDPSKRKTDTAFFILFVFCLLFAFWKTHYGFPSPDETFYTAMVQRFLLGDLPVIHEWNPAQFPAILLVPFYGLYLLFTHSAEGILLYFRILYVILLGAGGLLLYFRTRSYGPVSLAVSGIYMLYTFGNIQTMHYDTIGLFSVTAFVMFLVFPLRNTKLSYGLAGLFFALAVLCTPYLAIPYFLVTLILAAASVKSEKARTMLKGWVWFTLGAAVPAVIVTGSILLRSGVRPFLEHFPLMFSSTDSTYGESGGIIGDTIHTMYYGWLFSPASKAYLPVHLLFILLLGFGRQRSALLKKYAFPFLLVSQMILIVCYWKPGRDFSMLTFTLLGLLPVLFDRQFDRKGALIWLIGLVYGWMADLTSDTLLGVLSSATTVCMYGSLLMISSCLSRVDLSVQKAMKVLFISLCVLFMGMEAFDKLNYTYQDISPLRMDGVMERGPAKGIRSQKSYTDAYHAVLDDIEQTGIAGIGGNVLVYSNRSWIYLCLNGKCANYSTWYKPFEHHFVGITPVYYEKHPEKIPDVVYMPKNESIPYVMEREQFGHVEDLRKILAPYPLTLEETEKGWYAVREAR